jgi:hypothetical protein
MNQARRKRPPLDDRRRAALVSARGVDALPARAFAPREWLFAAALVAAVFLAYA